MSEIVKTCKHVGTEPPSNFSCSCCGVPVDECVSLMEIPVVFCDKCQRTLQGTSCDDVRVAWQNKEAVAR